MNKRIIDRYGHLKNVDFSDSIKKNGNQQRFYRAVCSTCQSDRGHIEPRDFNKLCQSCAKKKHSTNLKNVDYGSFIKEKGQAPKYKMTCLWCGASKGYKHIAYHNRRCYECSDNYLSQIKTKTTITQRKLKQKIPSILCDRRKSTKSSRRGDKIFKILGYTFDDLVKHLESQFEPWMNWDNHGIYNPNRVTWQIDHIVPDSSFTYADVHDQGFKDSWILSNLCPLEAMKNMIKGDK